MLEIIKTILELAKQSGIFDLNKILEWKKKKQMKALGADLFLVYVALNEIIINGEAIVENLEDMAGKGKRRTEGIYWFTVSLKGQYLSVRRFERAIKRLSCELQILDAAQFRRLYMLLVGKENALDRVLHLLQNERLPIDGLLIDDVPDASARDNGYDGWARILTSPDSFIATNAPVSEIKEYLKDRQPRKQLKALKTILTKMKKNLDEHFSVGEILAEIGDKRRSTPMDIWK